MTTKATRTEERLIDDGPPPSSYDIADAVAATKAEAADALIEPRRISEAAKQAMCDNIVADAEEAKALRQAKERIAELPPGLLI